MNAPGELSRRRRELQAQQKALRDLQACTLGKPSDPSSLLRSHRPAHMACNKKKHMALEKTSGFIQTKEARVGIDIKPEGGGGSKGGRMHAELMGRDGYSYNGREEAGGEEEEEEEEEEDVGGGDRAGGKGMLKLECVLEEANVNVGKCVTGLRFHPKYAEVLFSSHSTRTVTGHLGGTVAMWSLSEGGGRLDRVFHNTIGISAIEVGIGGVSCLVGGSVSGGVCMWDMRVRGGLPVVEFVKGHSGEEIVGIVDGGGGGFYSGGDGGRVCKWEIGREWCVGGDKVLEGGMGCFGVRRGGVGGGRGGMFGGGFQGGVYGISGAEGGWECEQVGAHDGMVLGMDGVGGKGGEDVMISCGGDWKAKVWRMWRGGGREVGSFELGGAGLDIGWSLEFGGVFGVGEEGKGIRVLDLGGELGDGRGVVGRLDGGKGVCRVEWGRGGVVCGGEGDGRIGIWKVGGIGIIGGWGNVRDFSGTTEERR